jgi:hypothetical protein
MKPSRTTAALSGVVALCFVLAEACGGSSPKEPQGPVRHKVLLEIDQMKDTPALEFDQVVRGVNVSLKSIYADAGIDLDIRRDQLDLPRQDEVSQADLHAMMSAFRTLEAPPDVMRVHALVLTRERDRADTLGIMFDFGESDADSRPREGFAIFADPHAGLQGGLKPELLLTLAHELAHCFNLHHPDWEGESFRSGSTIEGYSQADSVRWTLSANSKRHLSEDPGREVWPGKTNIGFGLITKAHLARHSAAPSEPFEVVEPGSFAERRPATTSQAALRRVVARDRSQFAAIDASPVKLRLELPKQNFVVGEPLVVTVGLHNMGQTSQAVLPLLDPKYRFLNIEVREPGGTEFETFQPVVLADARGARAQTLAPGASIHEEARIFFGADGWVFKKPGQYSIRADYVGPAEAGRPFEEKGRLQSNVLDVTISEPTTSSDRRARELILGPQQGLFLLLGGGDHLKTGASNLRKAVEEAPTATQSAAVRLALGTAALNPTINQATGVESQPRLDEAKTHLGGTLNAGLPALSVVKAQTDLAESLDEKGRTAEASRVRTATVKQLDKSESAKEYVDELKRPRQPSPRKTARPPAVRK